MWMSLVVLVFFFFDTSTQPPPPPRFGHCAVLLDTVYMYIFGGRYYTNLGESVQFDDTWRFNINTELWERIHVRNVNVHYFTF